MREKVIIINGNYRSGTTFIQKKLDNIKHFEVLMQPCFFIFKMYEEVLRKKMNLKFINDFPTGLFFNKKIFKTKAEDLKLKKKIIEKKLLLYLKANPKNKKFFFTKKLFYEILNNEINNINEKTISLKLFITILAKTIITYRKKFSYNRKIFYVGFKEGYLTSLLPILVNLKNIFVINLIRDPREIACSRNYSNNNSLFDFDTTKKHPIIMIALLCKNNMMIDRYLRKKKNYISIEFKNIFKKKNITIKKILIFLGLKSFKIKNEIINKETNNIWKKNTSSINNMQKPFGNLWRKKLKVEEIAILERICSKEMDKYDYKKILNKKEAFLLSNKFEEKTKHLQPWTNKRIFTKITKKLKLCT